MYLSSRQCNDLETEAHFSFSPGPMKEHSNRKKVEKVLESYALEPVKKKFKI